MSAASPTLTIIIPTIGRETLPRALSSIRDQAPASEVEVLVVGDSFGACGELVARYGSIRAMVALHDGHYLEYDGGHHAWGHPQRTHGATVARGRHLAFFQDDDAYLPGAFRAILEKLEERPGIPHLFKVDTWQAGPVWRRRGRLAYGEIDADCIVCPNDPSRMGTWSHRYEGDADFIIETVWLYGGPDRVAWDDDLIAVGRPHLRRPGA